MKVTIIITTWNSLDFLQLCLAKLFEYTTSPFEIIISDNGSSDGTKKYIKDLMKKWQKNILYIRSEKNEGTVQALKRVEPYITTKYVVLLDSDSIVSPKWVSTFIRIVVNNPKIKVIGPMKQGTQYAYPYKKDSNSRKIWDEVKRNNIGEKPEKLLSIYCQNKEYEKFVIDFLDVNKGSEKLLTCPPELLSGCCLFVDYEFLKKCGGLTNSIFGKYGGHDADRCWRASKAGGLIIKTDKVYIHHFEGSSLEKNKLNYRPLLYENNRKLLGIWHKEIWNFIENSGEDLIQLANKYWTIRELLLSADKNQIPKEYLPQFEEVKKSFVSTV